MASGNCGMGHNTNKGIRAAMGDYILQLQDDWECQGRPDFIEVALALFQARPDVALLRLWEPFPGRTSPTVCTRTGRCKSITIAGCGVPLRASMYTRTGLT